MEKIELLPCPFCGEEVEIRRMNSSYIIHRCPLSANRKTKIQVMLQSFEDDKKIAEFWNTRVKPAGNPDELGEPRFVSKGSVIAYDSNTKWSGAVAMTTLGEERCFECLGVIPQGSGCIFAGGEYEVAKDGMLNCIAEGKYYHLGCWEGDYENKKD